MITFNFTEKEKGILDIINDLLIRTNYRNRKIVLIKIAMNLYINRYGFRSEGLLKETKKYIEGKYFL